jgi:hypothetical protein
VTQGIASSPSYSVMVCEGAHHQPPDGLSLWRTTIRGRRSRRSPLDVFPNHRGCGSCHLGRHTV